MATYRFDIAYDFFCDKLGEDAARALEDGQTVTHVFADDDARPVKATIIKAKGPGGGNPFVAFEFIDDDHAWEWASALDMEVDEFQLGAA